MTDEVYQFPGVLIVMVGATPGRHPGQTDSVFDDIEQFAVGIALGFLLLHIGSRWVHVLRDLSIAASIIGMARGAVIGPVRARFNQNLGCARNRISLFSGIGRDRHVAGSPGGPSFHVARLLAGA